MTTPPPHRIWPWFLGCWGIAAVVVALTMLSESLGAGSGPDFSGPSLLLVFGGLIVAPIARSAVILWRRRGPARRIVSILLLSIAGAGIAFVGAGAWHSLQMNRCGAMSLIEQSEFRSVITDLAVRAESSQQMPRSITQLIHDGTFDIRRISRGCTTCDLTTVTFGPYTGRSIASQRMTSDALDTEIARIHPDPVAWEHFGPVTICLDPRPYATNDLMIIVACWPTEDAILDGRMWTHIALANGVIRAAFDGAGEPWELEALEVSIAYYDSIGIPMPEAMIADLRQALGSPK